MARRIVSIWFPMFAVERVVRARNRAMRFNSDTTVRTQGPLPPSPPRSVHDAAAGFHPKRSPDTATKLGPRAELTDTESKRDARREERDRARTEYSGRQYGDVKLSGEAPKPAVPAARPCLVVIEHGARGTRITAADETAQLAGFLPGRTLADAHVMSGGPVPGMTTVEADTAADTDAVERMAQWALRYSPTVQPVAEGRHTHERSYGVMLDTTGCDHLFGGEAQMLADMHRRLKAMGLSARIAVAPNLGAAHALSRFGGGMEIARDARECERLTNRLPVEALRISEERTMLLRRLGLRHIHALRQIPRQALERRFRSREDAQSVRLRLDQISGAIPEPLAPVRPAPPFRAVLPCPEPAIDIAAVGFALGELLVRLGEQMEARSQGARAYRLTAFHADGGSSAVRVDLSRASRERRHVERLFAEHLDRIDPGFGIDAFLLEAGRCEVLHDDQRSLVRDERPDESLAVELSGLVDTLSNRLGSGSVYRVERAESHVPERAWHVVDGNAAVAWETVTKEETRPLLRPFRLFDRPERIEVIAEIPDSPPSRFTWRRLMRQVIRARGPERIAPEWWREGAAGTAVRDYYEVEDTQGQRYWVFRAGHYTGDVPPEWFVHGVFA